MRLDPELWAEFKQKVKERGGTIAAVVSRLLRDYIDYG